MTMNELSISLWPKNTKEKLPRGSQVLKYSGGTRAKGQPGLITCEGSCSPHEPRWTKHVLIKGTQYKCDKCGTERRWGL